MGGLRISAAREPEDRDQGGQPEVSMTGEDGGRKLAGTTQRSRRIAGLKYVLV